MQKVLTLLLILILSSSFVYSQNSVKIQEFATLDSSSSNVLLGRQAVVIDHNNVIHLFYGVWGQTADSISQFTSSDNGITWDGPEIVSIYSHSSTYTREHIREISATVDENNNLHLVYRYDGPPNYISGWDAYPSSHISYVEKVDGNWVTSENVINDENVQAQEGNGSTVSYLKASQLLSYHNVQHFISYDYAWWANNYHIIYSNNSNGSWLGGDTLHTYNLGDFDNIILNAPSLVVNNDTLFALWYQRYDCTVEMKKFDGNNWSNVQTIFYDKYFPAPRPTSYIVYTGSVQQNGTHSATAMLRSVSDNYNELILLSKSQNSGWQVDTTQLNEKFDRVEPSIYKDTTYIYQYRNSSYTGSIIKFTKTNGFSEPIPMVLEDTTEQLIDLKSLSDASLPFAYVVRDTGNTYFLKVGKVLDLNAGASNENWIVYNTNNSDLPSNGVGALAIDESGSMWIGTEGGGLAKLDGTNWTVYNTSNSGLPNDYVRALAIDGSGNKWIGTWNGLTSFDGTNWIVYNTSNSGLLSNYIRDIAIDSNENKWIATYGGGLARFDGTNWIVYNTSNSGLPFNQTHSLAIDGSGNKWIGTWGGGLARFDGTNWTVFNISNSDLPDNWVGTLAIDGNGTKWIGTNNGMAMFDGTNWTIYQASNSGMPGNVVYSLILNGSGTKWIGTYRGGLGSFDGTNWNVYNKSNSGMPDDEVFSLAIDKNGNKWIGTANGGLAVYSEGGVVSVEDNKNNTPVSFSLSQNYPNPFNPSTTINYSLQKAGHVTLQVFDILGRKVAELVNSKQNAGNYSVQFSAAGGASNLSSGIYLYKLETGNFMSVKKMIVLK